MSRPAEDIEASNAVTAEARDWVVCLASREISEEQMERFKAWLAAAPAHRRAFETERHFWQRLEVLKAADRPQPAPQPKPTTSTSLRRRLASLTAAALAACLALAVAADPIRVALLADYETAVGAQREVALPDGSTAFLNTDSAIRVRFGDGERHIELLKGEAFFEVRRDKARPFRVAADEGTAEALGTAFVVDTADDGTTVAVSHGRVAVRATGDARVVLGGGQATRYAPGGAPEAARPATAAELAPWRSGTIRIDDLPLDRALAELDRYRKGRILLMTDSSRLRRVSGAFDIDGIDAAIRALAATQGLTVTEVTDYLVILR